MKTDILLTVKDVSISFGKVKALSHINCEFSERNGVIGLIGPNGAGKTTLIHSVFGFNKQNMVSGKILSSNKEMAYCPDTPEFPSNLTAFEVLTYSALISQFPDVSKKRKEELLTIVGLLDNKDQIASSFSRGMKQRLGIAASLILNPKILFLDEPTSALDPMGREDILNIIHNLSKDVTVVVSSHDLDDIQKIADGLIVLNKGKLIYSGGLNNFLKLFKEVAYIEVKEVSYRQKIISLLANHQIEILEGGDQFGENIITFLPEDFPKVLDLIDRQTASYIKLCINGENNLYHAFSKAIHQKKEELNVD
ncbi:ABC transporter ATP-binding protein [Streptococcus dentapri]|uniref:ABC transporter ATP-binding protein n=1 Tax=Streptococcus dentapri TaxID=573564 RepID=A0ABV8CZD9_9STRE